MFNITLRTVSTTSALLDRAKEVLDIRSDYMLAKRLGITQQAVSYYRNGKSMPAPEVTALLAEILKQPPLELIAMIEEERERQRDHPRGWVLELWRRYSPRLLPALVAALTIAGATQERTEAEGLTPLKSMDDLYIMRTLRRWFRSAKRQSLPLTACPA